MKCECGTEFEGNFCPKCGKAAPGKSDAAPTKSDQNIRKTGGNGHKKTDGKKRNGLIVVVVLLVILAIAVSIIVVKRADIGSIIPNKTSTDRIDKENTEEVNDQPLFQKKTPSKTRSDTESGAGGASESDVNLDTANNPGSNGNQENEDEYDEYSVPTRTEYILPQSSSSYLSEDDVAYLSTSDLRLARNEIYARHGRMFDDQTLQAYFDSCSWYSPTIAPEDFTEGMLNQYEKANIELIKKVEASRS